MTGIALQQYSSTQQQQPFSTRTLLENLPDDAIASLWRNFRPFPSIWQNFYVTWSFGIASSVTYSEICQNFSNSVFVSVIFLHIYIFRLSTEYVNISIWQIISVPSICLPKHLSIYFFLYIYLLFYLFNRSSVNGVLKNVP